jgi:hypothetical protein
MLRVYSITLSHSCRGIVLESLGGVTVGEKDCRGNRSISHIGDQIIAGGRDARRLSHSKARDSYKEPSLSE